MTPKIPDQARVQRVVTGLRSRVRSLRSPDDPEAARSQRLTARVAALEAAVEDNRRLNQRLADVVDVVTEVLVPTVDRDDERLRTALARLTKTLDEKRDHGTADDH